MSGLGTSSVSAGATGATGFSVLADSFFDVFFDVTISRIYRLSADVSWLGAVPPYSGYARVQLMDVTNSLVPFEVQRDSILPGTASLDIFVPLSTGINYRLRGESHIAGGFATAGTYLATADWNFVLTVPEPMSAALFSIGVFTLTCFAGRQRKRLRP